MKQRNIFFYLIFTFLSISLVAKAQNRLNVNEMIDNLKEKNLTHTQRISDVAKRLIGSPARSFAETYRDSTRKDSDLLPFDSKQFVETAIALTYAADKINADSLTFMSELDAVKYRKGENSGYASNMIYISDWIADNHYRGKIKEKTYDFPDNTFIIKTLDYISLHRDEFAGFKDESQFERMKSIEMGLRAHKIPFMKTHTLGKKNIIDKLQSGDIIVIIGKENGMDLYDMGVVVIEDGVARLIHANPSEGKIVMENNSIYDYLKPFVKEIKGYRILRLPD